MASAIKKLRKQIDLSHVGIMAARACLGSITEEKQKAIHERLLEHARANGWSIEFENGMLADATATIGESLFRLCLALAKSEFRNQGFMPDPVMLHFIAATFVGRFLAAPEEIPAPGLIERPDSAAG